MATRGFPSTSLVAYATKGKASAFSVPASRQLYVYSATAMNNTADVADVGVMKRMTNSGFSVYRYTASGSAYTNITTAVQAGTASGIFTSTNNDGYVIQAHEQFGLFGLTVSTGQSGGTFSYQYWDGTTFQTLPTLEVPTDYSSTGDAFVVFQAPVGWAVGGPTGTSSSMWTIRVRGTTAPGGTVSVTAAWVGAFLALYRNVAANAGVQVSFTDSHPFVLNGGEGLMPYFSVADAANQFSSFYVIPNG